MIQSRVKNIAVTGMSIALGIVFALLAHMVPNGGRILLPMHFAVLLCGIVCKIPFGMICGILLPVISSLITGMNPAYLPSMICELAVYGLVSAVLYKVIKTENIMIRLYVSLIGAMILGRIVYGILNALIFNVGEYSMQIWITSTMIQGVVGIVVQLALIPPIIYALKKSKILN